MLEQGFPLERPKSPLEYRYEGVKRQHSKRRKTSAFGGGPETSAQRMDIDSDKRGKRKRRWRRRQKKNKTTDDVMRKMQCYQKVDFRPANPGPVTQNKDILRYTGKVLSINPGLIMKGMRLPTCYVAFAEERSFREKVVCVLVQWHDKSLSVALACYVQPRKAEMMIIQLLDESKPEWVPTFIPECFHNTTFTYEPLAVLRPVINSPEDGYPEKEEKKADYHFFDTLDMLNVLPLIHNRYPSLELTPAYS